MPEKGERSGWAVLSVRVPPAKRDALDAKAKSLGLRRSDLLERAVDLALSATARPVSSQTLRERAAPAVREVTPRFKQKAKQGRG